MAVTKIASKLTIGENNWQSIDLGNFNDCYLIAIKDTKSKTDTIDPETIKIIRFEIGIDSGIKNKPLTIQYVTLNFNDITSGTNEINKITAFTRLMNLPNQFYIRVVSVDDGLRTINKGSTSISLNINAVNLG